MRLSITQKVYLILLVLTGWFALIAQFYISVDSGLNPLPETIIRYFCYFTIEVNLILTICCTWLLLSGKQGTHFFTKTTTLSAVAVYIFIVGLVYNIILRSVWQPQGLQLVVDELLHVMVPVLFILYWLFGLTKSSLEWKNAYSWMIYPVVYIIVVMIRGGQSGIYPYPFLEIPRIGARQALINIAGITLLFFVIAFLFIAIARRSRKPK